MTLLLVFASAGIAQAATIYVNKNSINPTQNGLSWETACRTVQDGINIATSGDEIWVAQGTYVENVTLKAGVAAYGGFIGAESALDQRNYRSLETIIDGNNAGSVVTAPTGATSTTRIDGFTLRNGTGTKPPIYNFYYGGGVYCDHSSPTIANNKITGNSVTVDGGGIYCSYSSPTINNNVITANLAGSRGGGIYAADYSNPVIKDNEVSDNSASGGAGIQCNTYSNPTVKGNTISGNTGGGSYGGGIACYNGCSPVVTNNKIIGNSTGSNGAGIYFSGSVTPNTYPITVANNIIAGNTATGNGGGIYFFNTYNEANAKIENNTIIGNTGSSGGGITCDSSAPKIANNIIAFCNSGISNQFPFVQYNPILKNNDVYNNTGYNYAGLNAGSGDISADPMFADRTNGDYHLIAGSPCINAGDNNYSDSAWTDMDGQARILGSHVDIGADEYAVDYSKAQILYVNGSNTYPYPDGISWASAFTKIQDAINAASSGTEIWVEKGTYLENITLKDGVALYGGFTGTETTRDERDFKTQTTILDGHQTGSVVKASGLYSALTRVDGFTIKNGNGTVIGSQTFGGGIYCSAAKLTVANNTITENTVSTGSQGGGIYTTGSNVTVKNNMITGNTAWNGAAIYGYGETALITNNTLTGNIGTFGVGISGDALNGTIANNLIADNTALTFGGSGGGMYLVNGSSPLISNNTIARNTLQDSAVGGIVCVGSSSPVIANNIIAFNSNVGVQATNGSVPMLVCNDVLGQNINYSGITTGTTDISADPMFVDTTTGDYHLQSGSPCINAGDDSKVQSGWVDMDGEARIYGSHVDIGADETTFDKEAPTVWASPASCYFKDTLAVSLYASEDASIYYTTNGTTPTVGSSQYTGTPVNLLQPTILRFFARDLAGNDSQIITETYTVDNDAPEEVTLKLCGTGGNNGWFISPVRFCVAATDSLSGIAKRQYSYDGGSNWFDLGDSPETLYAQGPTIISYRAQDNAGNISETKNHTVTIDSIAPESTITIEGTVGDSGWYISDVTVTITAVDNVSGVEKIQYKLDNGDWQDYDENARVVIKDEGVKTLYYRAIDWAGNTETAHEKTFENLDPIPPQPVPIVPEPPSDGGGYYVSPPTIDISYTPSPIEPTGTPTYDYSFDCEHWTPCNGQVVIDEDGTWIVYVRVTDGAGNTSPPKAVTIKIDKSAPVTILKSKVGTLGLNGWYTSNVDIVLSAEDSVSGMKLTQYALNGNWITHMAETTGTTLSNITLSQEGTTTMPYLSKDVAGNIEDTNGPDIYLIDKTAPESTITLEGTKANKGWYTSDITVTLSAQDNASGVDKIRYSTDTVTWNDYQGAFVLKHGGTQRVSFYALDMAGNREATHTVVIPIDKKKPKHQKHPHGIPGRNGWYKSKVDITLDATDTPEDAEDVSGIEEIDYSFDGEGWSTYAPDQVITVSSEGETTLFGRSSDVAGNTEDTGLADTVKIDTTLPEATVALTGTAAGGWYRTDVFAGLAANDAISGVDAQTIKYSTDGTTWLPYQLLTIGSEGTTSLSYIVDDVAGNETTVTTQIFIDKTKPATDVQLVGTQGANSWYTSSVQVKLSAVDILSGVSAIMIDTGAGFGAYNANNPPLVSGDGTRSVSFYAIDNAGNKEDTQSVAFKIDTTAPTTSATFSGTNGTNGWYATNVAVTLTAVGSVSGVDSTEYRLDTDTAWTVGTSLVIAKEGTTTLHYRSRNGAGVYENEKSAMITIDKTKPTTTCIPEGTRGENNIYTTNVALTITGSDAPSGVSKTQYSLDGAPWADYQSSNKPIISKEGTTDVKYRSIDVAGNTEDTQSIPIAIDKTAPTFANSTPANGAVNVAPDTTITVTFSEAIQNGTNFNGISVNSSSTTITATTSISGNMLLIKPSTMSNNQAYTVVIPAGAVEDMAGLPTTGQTTIAFTTPDTILPTVTGTNPLDGATNVGLNTTVTVTFSEPVIQGAAFSGITLKDASGTAVSATVGVSGTMLTIDPNTDMGNNKLYSVTIPAGAVKDLSGNALAQPATFSFATPDTIAPKLVGTYPANGQLNVPLDTTITVTFDENITLANKSLIKVYSLNSKNQQVSVTCTDTVAGKVLYIDPTTTLGANKKYYVEIQSGAITDKSNNVASAVSFNFTTINETTIPKVNSSDPVSGATGVAITKTITLTYSETITAGDYFGSITLKDAAGKVATSTVSISGTKLTIDPVADLSANTTYTLSVPASAIKDPAGNQAAVYSMSFSTAGVPVPDTTPPSVLSTSPTNGSTGVRIANNITVTFSENIKAATLSGITVKNSAGATVTLNPIMISGAVLTIDPVPSLAKSTKYTVSIPAGAVADLADNLFNPTPNPYTFTFTTGTR